MDNRKQEVTMNNRKWSEKVSRLAVLALVAAGVVGFPLLSDGALVHRWSFNDGTADDSVGTAHGTLYGDTLPAITGGKLVLNPGSDQNQYMKTSAFTGETLGARTLVAWVTLSNLDQTGAGGVLGIHPAGVDNFDSIVYGERVAKQWMNGSSVWARTVPNNGGALETSTDEVMMAIVYDSDNSIKLYRNGVRYDTGANAGTLVTRTEPIAFLGRRHEWAAEDLQGAINEARIYNYALTDVEIQNLNTLGPDTLPGLVHQWTFNDGTANDTVGTAHGTLFGNTLPAITGGKLVLNPGSDQNQYMKTSAFTGETLGVRTLVAWVTLSNLDQTGAGGVLGIHPAGVDNFDSIVYGERVAKQWMNGSSVWARTVPNNGGALETSTDEVMMAIVYDSDNSIKLYRNGVRYDTGANAGTLVTRTEPIAVLGRRHEWAAEDLQGAINEARIYNTALSASEIAALYAEGPEGELKVNPAALNASTVVMTATTPPDGLTPPVYYFFTNTVNGATSGWISSTVWTNTGLTEVTTYGYRVKARDAATPPNETDWSPEATIVTPGWPTTSLYWDGGTADIAGNGDDASQGGSGTWNTAIRNWDLGSANPHVAWYNPNNDTAVFGGAGGTVTLGTVAAGSVLFTNFTGAYTLTGGSLALSSDLTVGATSGNVTLSTPVSGSGGMVKNGANTLTLNNTSTYTGGTVLNGGYTDQANLVDGVFGTGPVTLNNGAALGFSINTLTNSVVVNNGAFVGGNSFGDNTTGPITLNGQLTVDTSYTGNRHLSGIISGTGHIRKTGWGVGSLYLYGANTYSGGTSNQGGWVKLGHTHALGTGTLWMDGPDLGLGAEANLNVGTGITNNIVLLKDCTIQLWGNWPIVNYDMLLSGPISGPGGMTIIGNNKTLVLSGTNTYTGTTTLNASKLEVSGSLASTNIEVTATSTLVLLNNTSLSTNTVLRYAVGAANALNYTGRMYIQDLYTNNVPLPDGEYSSENLPEFITGTGRLNTGPLPPKGTLISFF